MRNILLTLGALAVSSSALASLPAPAKTSFLDNAQVIINAGLKFESEDLFANKAFTKVEPSVSAKAIFDKNYYVGASIHLDKDTYGNYGMKVGVQQDEGLLRPFVEVNTHIKRQTLVKEGHTTDADGIDVITTSTSHRYIETIGYSAGINVALNENIIPFVQVNDFIDMDKASLEAGTQVNISDGLGVKVGFQYGPQHHWHSANVDLTYAF